MKNAVRISLIFCAVAGLAIAVFLFRQPRPDDTNKNQSASTDTGSEKIKTQSEEPHPMSIEALRAREYPGGDFTIEETLANGSNYRQFVASYRSEGLKIYGLLTVPLTPKPERGFPAVIFVHGHIPPKQYSTTGSYPSYQATLARAGFVTFKPDLRGHGNSEGEAVNAHFSEKYVVDTMYAISYLKNYKEVDPAKIGYWGHSNGGEIGLRTVEVSKNIKAAVFWAGVVGSPEDMLETYNEKIPFLRNANDNPLVRDNGLPGGNPEFWKKLDPYTYLSDIAVPIELHHGTADPSVPIELSRHLRDALRNEGKRVELFEYAGGDHNISQNSGMAWQRTIEFFEDNL